MKANFKPNQQAGLSIIEAVVAIFIIGVVLIMYAAANNSLKLNGNSQRLELAQRIALMEMEDLRATDFASLPASGSFSNTLLSKLPNGAGSISITSVNSSLKQMVVTVTWTEPEAKVQRSATFTTYKTKNAV